MLARYRWRLPCEPQGACATEDLGVGPLLAKVLLARGIRSRRSAESYLHPSLESLMSLQGLQDAASRVNLAARRSETVFIHGDYDVDGITSTLILRESLQALGITPHCYIPDREDEGYGLGADAVHLARSRGTSLLIAADCGTSDNESVECARSLGMDVLILDHHVPHAGLPNATAIVNPHLSPGDAFTHYASAGVCFRLAQELLGDRAAQVVDLAALGTIADVMPLLGDNRAIVRAGLSALARAERPSVRALLQVARVSGALTARQVAFILAPRLNAAGRMGDAVRALDLLLERDMARAVHLAGELDLENRRRQELCQTMLEEALALTGEAGFPIAVFARDHWPRGLLGLVAGKLCEALERPCCAVSVKDGIVHGSARSTSELDIVSALAECSGHLLRFGGHSKAAGFSLEARQLDGFRDALARVTRDYVPRRSALDIDAVVEPGDLRAGSIRELESTEPCGEQNPRPRFLVKDQAVSACRRVGGSGQHLKLRLAGGDLEGVWFGAGNHADILAAGSGTYDLVVEPRISEYRGRGTVELHVLDARPTLRERIAASEPVPLPRTTAEPVWLPHTDAGHVMAHLRRAGRAAILLDGRAGGPATPEPGDDLIIDSPPLDPAGLREALSGAAFSRVICCFDEPAVDAFLADLDMHAPGRETLLRCHQTLLELGPGKRKLADYVTGLEQRRVARAGTAGTLAERSLSVLSEIGLARLTGDEVSVVRIAGRADLATSATFRESQAWRTNLERFYNLIGRSPQVLAEWLGVPGGGRAG
ncbi:MAG: single-stranded-DNA-specific exonuclease RecJ [Bacillota bacterium]|nr:single-stranded-DNA-specific exonuclease RecJ [Bacillota bacterium]